MHAWGIATLNAYRAGSGGIDALEAYDSVSARVSIVSLIVLATSGICWLVWQYRAAASVPAGALRRSPGWQVGSWFIPVVSLWFPFQNISDLAAGARAALGRGVRAGWWALWIAGGVTSGIGGRALITADTLDSLVSALTILILSEALVIASAAFAWIVVARITDAVDPAVH